MMQIPPLSLLWGLCFSTCVHVCTGFKPAAFVLYRNLDSFDESESVQNSRTGNWTEIFSRQRVVHQVSVESNHCRTKNSASTFGVSSSSKSIVCRVLRDDEEKLEIKKTVEEDRQRDCQNDWWFLGLLSNGQRVCEYLQIFQLTSISNLIRY